MFWQTECYLSDMQYKKKEKKNKDHATRSRDNLPRTNIKAMRKLPFTLPAFLANKLAQFACWKAYMPYADDIADGMELYRHGVMSLSPIPTD